jgi:archaellum biogenesis ATPase FlaH
MALSNAERKRRQRERQYPEQHVNARQRLLAYLPPLNGDHDMELYAKTYHSHSKPLQEDLIRVLSNVVGDKQDYCWRLLIKNLTIDMFTTMETQYIFHVVEQISQTTEKITRADIHEYFISNPEGFAHLHISIDLIDSYQIHQLLFDGTIMGTPEKVIQYMNHIKDIYTRSQLMDGLDELRYKLMDRTETLPSILSSFAEKIEALSVKKSVSFHDKLMSLRDLEIPKPFFGGLIPPLGITILFAPAKTGKTAFLNTIALRLAKGESFHQIKNEAVPQKILIVDFEMTNIDYRTRFGNTNEFEKLDISVFNARNLNDIKNEINIIKPNIVFIDNLSALMDDLLNTKEIKETFNYFKSLEHKMTLVLVAHSVKSSFNKIQETQNVYGTVFQLNMATSVCSLNVNPKNPDEIYLKQHASRRAPDELVCGHQVLLMKKQQKNGVFFTEPLQIVDERLLYEDETILLASYKSAREHLDKGATPLGFCRNNGISVKELSKILELGEILAKKEQIELKNQINL